MPRRELALARAAVGGGGHRNRHARALTQLGGSGAIGKVEDHAIKRAQLESVALATEHDGGVAAVAPAAVREEARVLAVHGRFPYGGDAVSGALQADSALVRRPDREAVEGRAAADGRVVALVELRAAGHARKAVQHARGERAPAAERGVGG